MKEFRKLKSLKFLYEVSMDGVVRNVKSKKELKGEVGKNGYKRFKFENKSLSKDGYIRVLAHRLVAEAWIPNPYEKPNVNHKNGNRLDNRVENLEWCTHQENMKHAFKSICSDVIKKNLDAGRAEKIKVTNGCEVFDSIRAAATWLSCNGKCKNMNSGVTGIRMVLNSLINSFGGYVWKRVSTISEESKSSIDTNFEKGIAQKR